MKETDARPGQLQGKGCLTLVLSRKEGERVRLRLGGLDVWVHVAEFHRDAHGTHLRLAFSAPPQVKIMREELLPEAERYEATHGSE